MAEYNKPVPLPGPLSQPFFDGAKRHELLVMRCQACGTHRLTERSTCPECWSEKYEWVRVSGQGEVYTYVLMHQQVHPGFADEIPYNVAVIELAEGPRLVSNIVECANEDLRVGMSVEAVFDDITNEVALVRFRPMAK